MQSPPSFLNFCDNAFFPDTHFLQWKKRTGHYFSVIDLWWGEWMEIMIIRCVATLLFMLVCHAVNCCKVIAELLVSQSWHNLEDIFRFPPGYIEIGWPGAELQALRAPSAESATCWEHCFKLCEFLFLTTAAAHHLLKLFPCRAKQLELTSQTRVCALWTLASCSTQLHPNSIPTEEIQRD